MKYEVKNKSVFAVYDRLNFKILFKGDSYFKFLLKLYEKGALTQVFFCEYCKSFINDVYIRHFRWLFLGNI